MASAFWPFSKVTLTGTVIEIGPFEGEENGMRGGFENGDAFETGLEMAMKIWIDCGICDHLERLIEGEFSSSPPSRRAYASFHAQETPPRCW
jgi:hypothetical protein